MAEPNVGPNESRGFVTDGLIQGPARWPQSLGIEDISRLSVTGAGVVLPNINNGYTGKAPDLGCCELGAPLPHYGPRP